jgi:hypothetical protein
LFVRRRLGSCAGLRVVALFGAALAGSILSVSTMPVPALAACTPAAGAGTPAAGTTVTCSGTTTDQNAPAGYGEGSQTGLTINVQPGATVTGTAGDGLLINDFNTVNNDGTIDGQGGSGINAGPNLTVTNSASGIIRGVDNGIISTSATVTNYGLITATGGFGVGIDVVTGTVNNLGIISANVSNGKGIIAITDLTLNNAGRIEATGAGNSLGVWLQGTGTVNNTGTITGRVSGVFGQNTATINNAGTITATDTNGAAVFINNTGTVINSGTISASGAGGAGVVLSGGNVVNRGTIVGGDTGVLLGGFGTSLSNAGTIRGTFAAIDASFTDGAILTFLPGNRIFGPILLGLNTTLNIATGGDVSSLMNFGSCGCGGLAGATVTFSNGTIGVVSGDSIATLDPTGFAFSDRTLLDFTNALSAVLNGRLGVGAAGSAAAFAATGGSVAAQANDAFAHVPGLAYANEGYLANAASYDRATGIGVWSRGFVGGRHQNADGALLAADTTSYGGLIGLDKMVAADLRLGAFIGAGHARLGVDRDSQTIKTDTVFAGVFGRKTFDTNAWGTPYLDVMASAGHTGNDSRRLVASNLSATGYETATANYNGWFVSPEIAYGVVMPLAGRYTLTPSARLRYLASHFGGYGETGSTQALSVSARTTHNLEQRAELALTYHDGGLRTTWTVGALAAERIGGKTVDTVLIGAPLSFAMPGDDVAVGLYGGFGFDVQITGAASVYAAMQGTVMSDDSRSGLIQGGLRVAF